MNSLGELLLSRGVPISGSDRLRTDVTARLEALGAKITYEHKPENVEGASLIVRTLPCMMTIRRSSAPMSWAFRSWSVPRMGTPHARL